MKTISVLSCLLAVAAASLSLAADRLVPGDETTPPPVVAAPARPASPDSFTYEQRPLSGLPDIISPDQVEDIIKKFRAAYPKMGNPRILIYVNRELVDERSGMKLVGRTEKVNSRKLEGQHEFIADPHTARGSNALSVTVSPQVQAGRDATVVGVGAGIVPGKGSVNQRSDNQENDNTYAIKERPHESVEYKTFVRDAERLFGRALRSGGASMADQRVATQLIADRPLSQFTVPTEGEQARKDREALAAICDVVIEVLRHDEVLNVPQISGDRPVALPMISATAIRLKDSKIIGQASSSDFLGRRNMRATWLNRNFLPRDIAEATAIKLMEDMTSVENH